MGLAYAIRSASKQAATDGNRVAILAGLLRRSRAGEIGAIWTEDGGNQLFIDVGRPGMPVRRRLRWDYAQRIAAGESWRQVLKMQEVTHGEVV
jgi:hypothetical protein